LGHLENDVIEAKDTEHIPYANLNQKIRVLVGTVDPSGAEIGMREWPLDEAFYIRHLDKDGTETIYKLYPFCAHGKIMAKGCKECP